MNREAVIQAAYFAVLAMGQQPSQRTLQAMAKRICDKQLQTRDILSFLRFKRQNKEPQLHRSSTSESESVLKTSDSVAPQLHSVAPQLHRSSTSESESVLKTSDSVAPQLHRSSASRARIELETEEIGLVAIAPKPISASRKRSQTRMDLRTYPEVIADEVLGELKPLVGPALQGITWSDWRMRNRRYLVSMAKADMTAAEILEAYHAESEQLGEPIRSVKWLQERLNAQTSSPYARREASERKPSREDMLPTLTELIDAGKIPDWGAGIGAWEPA